MPRADVAEPNLSPLGERPAVQRDRDMVVDTSERGEVRRSLGHVRSLGTLAGLLGVVCMLPPLLAHSANRQVFLSPIDMRSGRRKSSCC
jgi:hypothetical protein